MKKNILYWRSWMSYLLVTIVRFSSGCFKEIYQDSIIYKSMDCANELYIYVGSAETQEERKRVQFLLDTFYR